MGRKILDLTEHRFGKLKVIRLLNKDEIKNKSYKGAYWLCKCDCGIIKSLKSTLLRQGVQSCGCLAKNNIKKAIHKNIKHGDCGTSFYKVWRNIITRCYCKTCKHYKFYGKRGITVCNEWKSYEKFKEDMYESYVKHKQNNISTTIERINNDSLYCKINCRWATQTEQTKNRRPLYLQKSFKATYIKTGYEEISNSQSCFAKKYNLWQTAVGKCLNGKQKIHKNWKFKYFKN